MKILCIVNYYKYSTVYGGPARSIPLMCEALARAGADVTVFTTNANGATTLNVPLRRAVDEDGVRVFYYPALPVLPRSYFFSPELSTACLRETKYFDIAILETLFTDAMSPAASACLRSSTPYIVPLRGQLLPWALQHKPLKKKIYLASIGHKYLDRASGLQCSDEVEQSEVSALGFHAPTLIVPNGIRVSDFADMPARGLLRQRLNIRADELILLFLGRLHAVKRPDLALQTLAGLQRDDVHLIFAGPDEENYQPRLMHEARVLRCENRIHFTGLLSREEIKQAFVDSDLLLMPSAMESFGMAVVESLAAGLPALVSENIPIGRWIEENGAGRVAALDVDSLVRAASSMLTDRAQLKQMGQRGRVIAQDRFDISSIARSALMQYDSIIKTGRPPESARRAL